MKTKNASMLVVLAPLLLAACNVSFIEGATDDGGANDPAELPVESGSNDPAAPPVESGSIDTAGSGSSGGDAEPGDALPAVALTRAQMDVLWDRYWESQGDVGGSSGSGGGDGPALDPDDLFLRASDLGVSCGSPTTQLRCGGHWQLSIVLPSAYQQVGVYDLEDPALISYSHMSETGEPYSPRPDDCPWGGGSFGPGTLEILSIDNAEVRFRLTVGSLWDTDPSGEYTAPRCP
ncbi:hypothetical protein [Sorangium atrum]|uniref:Secreted protein n=1 Tax=Sorangium atrum TaxID=2995308 RepID=A0ABT5BVH7_9BACT|nr:hypothetical protein [Sorangium aterium]MDC0678169.1 hypothetical protein [Sorangium aterium]